MKQYEIAFIIEGPGGAVCAPNATNPVKAIGLADVLRQLAENLPTFGFGAEVVGVSVKEVNVGSGA